MRKRILSLLLCIVLCMSLMPIAATAAPGEWNEMICWKFNSASQKSAAVSGEPITHCASLKFNDGTWFSVNIDGDGDTWNGDGSALVSMRTGNDTESNVVISPAITLPSGESRIKYEINGLYQICRVSVVELSEGEDASSVMRACYLRNPYRSYLLGQNEAGSSDVASDHCAEIPSDFSGKRVCFVVSHEPYCYGDEVKLALEYFSVQGKEPESPYKDVYFYVPDGASCPVDKLTTDVNGHLNTLPTPSYPGFEFIGWEVNGTPVDINTVFTETTILDAQWKKIRNGKTYAITVECDAPFGITDEAGDSITAAEPGEKVTLHTVGDKFGDLYFHGWEIISGNTTLSDRDAADSSFIMPEGDVVFRAVYNTTPFSFSVTLKTETGTVDGGSGTRVYTDRLGFVPYIPEPNMPKGYVFSGWFNEKYGILSKNTVITEDTEFIAEYGTLPNETGHYAYWDDTKENGYLFHYGTDADLLTTDYVVYLLKDKVFSVSSVTDPGIVAYYPITSANSVADFSEDIISHGDGTYYALIGTLSSKGELKRTSFKSYPILFQISDFLYYTSMNPSFGETVKVQKTGSFTIEYSVAELPKWMKNRGYVTTSPRITVKDMDNTLISVFNFGNWAVNSWSQKIDGKCTLTPGMYFTNYGVFLKKGNNNPVSIAALGGGFFYEVMPETPPSAAEYEFIAQPGDMILKNSESAELTWRTNMPAGLIRLQQYSYEQKEWQDTGYIMGRHTDVGSFVYPPQRASETGMQHTRHAYRISLQITVGGKFEYAYSDPFTITWTNDGKAPTTVSLPSLTVPNGELYKVTVPFNYGSTGYGDTDYSTRYKLYLLDEYGEIVGSIGGSTSVGSVYGGTGLEVKISGDHWENSTQHFMLAIFNSSNKSSSYANSNGIFTQNVYFDVTWADVPVYYDVRFEPNGGTGTMSSDSAVAPQSSIFKYADYTFPECRFIPPEDKVFDCWEWHYADLPDYLGWNPVNPGETDSFNRSIVARPVWVDRLERTTCDVTFNMNGHGNQVADQTVNEGAKATKPADPTASGWTFNGWYADAAFSAMFDFNTAINADTTIYAKWTQNITPPTTTYTVSFNMNGHGDQVADQTVNEGAKANKPADPTASGWTFDGWYADATFSAAFDFDTAIAADTTIYAKWTKNTTPPATTYTVTFNMNGHGDQIAAQTVNEGAKATKPADPTAEGWTFGGWYADATFNVAFDFNTAITANTTIYAKWTENTVPQPPVPTTYTVSFNMNGHGTQVADQMVNAGEKVTEPAEPTAIGYMFVGWYKDSAFNTVWNFDTDTVTENTTLNALWAQNIQKIIESINVNVTAPAVGSHPDYSPVITATPNEVTSLCKVYLTPAWICADTESDLYNGNGTVMTAADTFEAGKYYAFSIQVNTLDAIVAGWQRSSTIVVTINGSVIDSLNHNVLVNTFGEDIGWLRAAWKMPDAGATATYTVNFNMNSHGTQVEAQTVKEGEKATKPADPSASGYTFDGWYLDEFCTTEFDFNTPITAAISEIDANGLLRLWAKWTENAPTTYTITFNANGGSVTPASDTTGTDGKLASLPTPTRSGSYRFDGWYTAANGGTVVNANTVFTADTTIYAHWRYTGGGGGGVTYYMLTFNTNGGSAISSVSGTYGKVIDLDKYVPTKSGYDFGGWYSDSALTNPVDEIKLNGNKTVYAKWTEKAPVAPAFPFTDVNKTDWSYDDIYYVWEKGLMQGTSETTFAPKIDTSRAMIVTILWRLEGEPIVNYAMSFDDVADGQWYTEAIRWAQANGIVKGYSAEKFGTNDPITREQMAAILYRYAGFKGYDVSAKADLSKFADSDKIGGWAVDAIAWANANNLVNGVSTTELAPQGKATREQVAAILHRFCENIVK